MAIKGLEKRLNKEFLKSEDPNKMLEEIKAVAFKQSGEYALAEKRIGYDSCSWSSCHCANYKK